MQALQLDAIHQPTAVRDVPTPTPGPGEILVKLHAAALNHRDVWIQKGQYAGIKLPCTLGADGAGVVAAHGPNVPAEASAVGARVLVYPGLRWGEQSARPGQRFRSARHARPRHLRRIHRPAPLNTSSLCRRT